MTVDRDYHVPPAMSYGTESVISAKSARSASNINGMVNNLRSVRADYRDAERTMNDSLKYEEDEGLKKENGVLIRQLMFYRDQSQDLDKKLREAANLLEKTVLEMHSGGVSVVDQRLMAENQELKKIIQEMHMRGGTSNESSIIKDLQHRIREQDRQLEASKMLYNKLRQKFDDQKGELSTIMAEDIGRNVVRDGPEDGPLNEDDGEELSDLRAKVRQQERTIVELNENMAELEEYIQSKQNGQNTFEIFKAQEDQIEVYRKDNARLRSEVERLQQLEIMPQTVPVVNYVPRVPVVNVPTVPAVKVPTIDPNHNLNSLLQPQTGFLPEGQPNPMMNDQPRLLFEDIPQEDTVIVNQLYANSGRI